MLDCTGCLAPCCRELTIVEVARSEVHECMVFDAVPPDGADPAYAVYLLGRREDGACVHLGDDNRCTIYEHRPSACRDFDCRGDDRIEPQARGPAWCGADNKADKIEAKG